MDDDLQPRNPELGAVLVFLAVVMMSTLCVGGILLFNQYNQRRIASPTQAPLPVFAPIPTATAMQVVEAPTLFFPTLTPTITPTTAVLAAVPTSGGKSCKYGPTWINLYATPVPDGKRSVFENFLCVNGYWYLGNADWVDGRTGDWGMDGIQEQGYVVYNADGSVADRKFLNLQGTQIPGPTK